MPSTAPVVVTLNSARSAKLIPYRGGNVALSIYCHNLDDAPRTGATMTAEGVVALRDALGKIIGDGTCAVNGDAPETGAALQSFKAGDRVKLGNREGVVCLINSNGKPDVRFGDDVVEYIPTTWLAKVTPPVAPVEVPTLMADGAQSGYVVGVDHDDKGVLVCLGPTYGAPTRRLTTDDALKLSIALRDHANAVEGVSLDVTA